MDYYRNQLSSGVDAIERNHHRKQWAQDILSMMGVIISAAVLLISAGVLAGIFTLQEALPIYLLLGCTLPAWWAARRRSGLWVRLFPVSLCFLLGVIGSYNNGLRSISILFYVLSALLAGILIESRWKWAILLLSMVSISGFSIRLEGMFTPDMLAPLITIFFGLVGIMLLQWYIDARLWQMLADQKEANRRLTAEIIQRQQAEIALREQDAQLHRLAENTNDFIAEIDPVGTMRYVSPSHQTGLGYSLTSLMGSDAFELIHPDDRQKCREAARQALESRQPSRLQARCRHADGHYIHVEISGVPLFDEIDQAAGFVLSSRDISLQHSFETALVLSEEKFSKAFQSSPDSININRLADGIYIETNSGFTELMGYTREEVIGKSSLELNIWADPADRARLVQGLRETREVNNMEARFRRKNGQVGVGLMSARLLEIVGETCILSITRDITERQMAETALRWAHFELEEAYEATLQGWVRAMELHEHNTAAHSRRVVQLTLQIARAMGIADEDLIWLQRGALLHDIGKMGVSEQALLKPGRLDANEWESMRRHPEVAYHFLKDIHYLRQAVDIPYSHHEHWDGSGYPRGLRGEEIPLAARIFTVVDVFDALTSDRPYRPAWSAQQAREYMIDQRGCLFDPRVVDIFLKILQTNL
jgi:PAS domain S-box-containing protein/putative nucleotidyltransferase with HDIG domain